jgi:DNA-binding MurR/RpiR family transcriptional regulator
LDFTNRLAIFGIVSAAVKDNREESIGSLVLLAPGSLMMATSPNRRENRAVNRCARKLRKKFKTCTVTKMTDNTRH